MLARLGAGVLGLRALGCAEHSVTPLTAGLKVPFLTPVADHFVKNGAEGSIRGWSVPSIDADTWRLEITGLVDTPRSISLAEIVSGDAGETVGVLKTLQCVVDSGTAQGLVGTAVWRGVALAPLIAAAGVQAGARRLHLFGADGFTNNLPLHRLGPEWAEFADEAPAAEATALAAPPPLLATHMNGEPLSRAHGAPVRLLVPDAFGYASVKWIERIEVTADDSVFGTYQDAGFTDDSRAPVVAKTTRPTDRLKVPAGLLTCDGFAVSGLAGVAEVLLQVDDGPWSPVRLGDRDATLVSDVRLSEATQFRAPDRFSWPFAGVWITWSHTVALSPGRHLLRVRAVDRLGRAQPDRDTDFSDGVNAVSTIFVEAE